MMGWLDDYASPQSFDFFEVFAGAQALTRVMPIPQTACKTLSSQNNGSLTRLGTRMDTGLLPMTRTSMTVPCSSILRQGGCSSPDMYYSGHGHYDIYIFIYVCIMRVILFIFLCPMDMDEGSPGS